MTFPNLENLPDYPFDRLRALLDPVAPPAGLEPIALSIGEPRHDPPAFVPEILEREKADWNRYPPIDGTPALRAAVAGWLTRRFALADGFVDADRHVLPCVGTREALFMIAALMRDAEGVTDRRALAFPNPFYHVYAGAAVLNGYRPVPLATPPETGFLPDLAVLSDADWSDAALLYLCNPANPQGAVAPLETLIDAVRRCRETGTVLIVDECYADLYDDAPPAGALQACERLGPGPSGDAFEGVLIFHSVSKRSSAPGLRSGFVAGDAGLIDALRRYRNYAGATMPMPIQAASAALWADDAHAEANRALYRAKIDAAQAILGDRFGFYRPAGGFFLWLNVDDGERACRVLWRDAALRVLPGAYLGRAEDGGRDACAPYIRIALVHPKPVIEEALGRLVKVL
jgi:N-succinyldiaminopimelate aminotransferase